MKVKIRLIFKKLTLSDKFPTSKLTKDILSRFSCKLRFVKQVIRQIPE